MTDKPLTQLDMLAKHFRRRKTITSTEAETMYGVKSLSRRILDMEDNGYQFNRVPFVSEGRRMVRYQIVKAA